MNIGRFSFGSIKGKSDWGYDKPLCGCKILSLGRLYFTWLDKECKCQTCKKYVCICKDEDVNS